MLSAVLCVINIKNYKSAGWFQESLDVSPVDFDSSVSDDDADESVSNSFLTPLEQINGELGDSLLRDNSASSDVEDTVEKQKPGPFALFRFFVGCLNFTLLSLFI